MYQVFRTDGKSPYFQMIQGEENVFKYVSSLSAIDINKNSLIDKLNHMRGFESTIPFDGVRILRISK